MNFFEKKERQKKTKKEPSPVKWVGMHLYLLLFNERLFFRYRGLERPLWFTKDFNTGVTGPTKWPFWISRNLNSATTHPLITHW